MARTVGIFSRSSEGDYRWLKEELSKDFHIQPFCISNSNRYQFQQAAGNCVFAILYHTKNRGRINLTDVTDSLYDEEVLFLHDELGRDRVIAVIDDLEDSSSEVKDRILTHQQRLRTMTRDIFLFTNQEKANQESLRQRISVMRDLMRRCIGPDKSGMEPGPPIQIDMPKKPFYTGDNLENYWKGHPGSDNKPKSTRHQKLQPGILFPPAFLVFWITYHTPNKTHGCLSILWVVMIGRYLFSRKSIPLLPLSSWGQTTVRCFVTLLSVINAFSHCSISNLVLSGLWFGSCSECLFPGLYQRRKTLNALFRQTLGYALVLFTFGKAYTMPASSEVLGEISRNILMSPAILAAELF